MSLLPARIHPLMMLVGRGTDFPAARSRTDLAMVRSQRCKGRCAMWAFCDFTVTRTDKCMQVPSDRYQIATNLGLTALRQSVLFVCWFVCRGVG
jgi:hypothetical protein